MEGSYIMVRILIFFTLIILLNACSNSNNEYKPSKISPSNIRIEYYKELVGILNKINKNMLTNIEYTEKEHQDILRFFMINNSKTDEEFAIKTKLSLLDVSSNQYFKAIRTNDMKLKETSIKYYQDELKEIEILLNISSEHPKK